MDCFWLKRGIVRYNSPLKYQNIAHFTFVSTIGSCRSMIRSWIYWFIQISISFITISIDFYWFSLDFYWFSSIFYWFSMIFYWFRTNLYHSVVRFPAPTVLYGSQPSTVPRELMWSKLIVRAWTQCCMAASHRQFHVSSCPYNQFTSHFHQNFYLQKFHFFM